MSGSHKSCNKNAKVNIDEENKKNIPMIKNSYNFETTPSKVIKKQIRLRNHTSTLYRNKNLYNKEETNYFNKPGNTPIPNFTTYNDFSLNKINHLAAITQERKLKNTILVPAVKTTKKEPVHSTVIQERVSSQKTWTDFYAKDPNFIKNLNKGNVHYYTNKDEKDMNTTGNRSGVPGYNMGVRKNEASQRKYFDDTYRKSDHQVLGGYKRGSNKYILRKI